MQSIELAVGCWKLEVTNKKERVRILHTFIISKLDHFEPLLIDNNGKTMIIIAF